MALPGETIKLGASRTCEDCGVTVEDEVYKSPAGLVRLCRDISAAHK